MPAQSRSEPQVEWDYSERSIQNIRRSAAWLALLVLAYAIAVSWFAWNEVKREKIDSLGLVVALESRTISGYLGDIERELTALGEDLTHANASHELTRAHAMLKRYLTLHPELFNVSLTQTDGSVLVTARTGQDQTMASTATQPSFAEFIRTAQRGKNFSVGLPVIGAVSMVPIVPLRMAIRGADGSIAFIISASLPEDYLSAYWKNARTQVKSTIGIARDDGFLISLYPIPRNARFSSLYEKPVATFLTDFMAQSGWPQSGDLITTDPNGASDELTVFQRVTGYPLTLFLRTSMSEIRSAWFERIRTTYLSILLLIAASAVAYRLALRRQSTWNARQRAAEAAVRASEERFRTLIDSSNAIILQIDRESGQIVDANAAAIRFYGYPRDAMVGQRLCDAGIMSADAFSDQVRLISAGGQEQVVCEHRLASGETRTVECHVTPLTMGDRHIFVSIITDISLRMRAEERTRTLLGEHEAILNSSIAGIAKVRNRCFVWVNDAFARALGYRPEELEGQSVRIAYPSNDDYESIAQESYPTMHTQPFYSTERRLVCKDGTIKWFELRGAIPQTQGDESLWSVSDISERRQSMQRIESLLAEQRAILNNRLVGIVTVNHRSVLWANQAFADMLSYDPADLTGKSTRIFYETDNDWIALGQQAYPILSSGDLFRGQTRFVTSKGHPIWVEISSQSLNPDGGDSLWCFVDITDRKRVEEELRESSAWLTAIIENEPESICILDMNCRVRQINPGGLALIEAEAPDTVLGRDYREFVSPEYRDAYTGLHERVLRGERVLLEYEIVGAHGTRRWLETHAVPMTDHGQAVSLAVARDITERKRLYSRVRQMAFQDSLTGLPNRRLLIDRLELGMSASRRTDCYGALIFVDLDNFKPLNDGHGHSAGDLLLVEVARRLRACVREIDTVARFGGDEFVIVLGQLSTERLASRKQAFAVADKIRITLAQPYALTLVDDTGATVTLTHQCTASIGIALFLGRESGQDEILRQADAAMYSAKQSGRNCIHFAGDEQNISRP